jgi:hypothetical protein
MRKYLYSFLGFSVGLGIPIFTLLFLWVSPHPEIALPNFIIED